MNQNDSLLTKNQKTGLMVVGFSFLTGLMIFLVGTGILILSLSLFVFGVYMFFEKDKPIDTTIPVSYKKIPGLLKYSVITNNKDTKNWDGSFYCGIETDINDDPSYAGYGGNPFTPSSKGDEDWGSSFYYDDYDVGSSFSSDSFYTSYSDDTFYNSYSDYHSDDTSTFSSWDD